MPARVLVADDEEKIARMVASYLEASGFEALLAADGIRALALFEEKRPDCLVLDINMPGMDGLEVARAVRRSSDVPIIFLTARADETDRIVGLELGADDYVVKPFSPRELVARVRAVLRRAAPARGARGPGEPGATGPAAIRIGEAELDPRKRSLRLAGRPIALTSAQFDILALLMREPGRVFTRLEILEAASGTSHDGYERTVDAQVKNIRRAMGDDSEAPAFIETVRGVGYRFIERFDEA